MSIKEKTMNFAIESRLSVFNHDKFIQIFGEFGQAIHIDKEFAFASWKPLILKMLGLGFDCGI